MHIERGFQNNYGKIFSNIINVSFSSITELKNHLGNLILETKKDNNNFVTLKDDYDGIYLYEMLNKEDSNYAYRLYRDYEKYKYRRHYDDLLISNLQEKQKLIKNVDFPIGVVTIENEVIGQIIYLYKQSQTIFNYLKSIKSVNIFEKKYYTLLYEVLKILQSLKENDIYYIDIHPNNFLRLNNGTIKIIDFENHSIDYSNNKENYFRHNLFYIINDINKYFGLSSNINYSDSIEDIYNKVREKTY